MSRMGLRAVGAILPLLAGLLAAPVRAQDCVRCDASAECVSDFLALTACSCNIRFIAGVRICHEKDFFCSVANACNNVPLPYSTGQLSVPIEPGVFNKLREKEPLLSLMLQALVIYEKDYSMSLSLESYPNGTLHGEDKQYTHRGILTKRPDGEAGFHFVLENLKDGSTTIFAGILRDRGRVISYAKIFQLSREAVPQKEVIEWKAK